jgi:hypothetical protein
MEAMRRLNASVLVSLMACVAASCTVNADSSDRATTAASSGSDMTEPLGTTTISPVVSIPAAHTPITTVTLPTPGEPTASPVATTIVPGDSTVVGVRVSADDRTLVVMTYGNNVAFPVESPCWDRYVPSARRLDGTVHLDLSRVINGEPDRTRHENCDAGAFIHSMTLVLDRPLANAPIVSGSTTLRVFHESDLLVPTWLPTGWSLASEIPEQDPQASWYLRYEPDDRSERDPTSPADPERPLILVATYADDLSATCRRPSPIVARMFPCAGSSGGSW